jgi:hypothetical protein
VTKEMRKNKWWFNDKIKHGEVKQLSPITTPVDIPPAMAISISPSYRGPININDEFRDRADKWLDWHDSKWNKKFYKKNKTYRKRNPK